MSQGGLYNPSASLRDIAETVLVLMKRHRNEEVGRARLLSQLGKVPKQLLPEC